MDDIPWMFVTTDNPARPTLESKSNQTDQAPAKEFVDASVQTKKDSHDSKLKCSSGLRYEENLKTLLTATDQLQKNVKIMTEFCKMSCATQKGSKQSMDHFLDRCVHQTHRDLEVLADKLDKLTVKVDAMSERPPAYTPGSIKSILSSQMVFDNELARVAVGDPVRAKGPSGNWRNAVVRKVTGYRGNAKSIEVEFTDYNICMRVRDDAMHAHLAQPLSVDEALA